MPDPAEQVYDDRYFRGQTSNRVLNLTGSGVRDEDLVLARGRSIHTILLGRTGTGDQGLAQLAGMNDIQVLDLRGTKVTDAGMAHVATMLGLKIITVSETEVSDAGLALLTKLPHLERIIAQKSQVTSEAQAALFPPQQIAPGLSMPRVEVVL